MYKFLIFFISFGVFSSEHMFEPRSVFQCGMMAVIEGKLDEYSLLQGIGSFSGPSRPIAVNLIAEKVGEECVITVSAKNLAVEPAKYYFNKFGNPLEGKISIYSIDPKLMHITSAPICTITTRYQDTFGKCRVPTKDDSRDQCYDLPGRPLQVELREATFSSWVTLDKYNRIDLFSGGVQLQTYIKNEKDEFFKSAFFNIWKEGKDWCIYQSETFSDQRGNCSTKLGSNFELRNKSGEIIGLVQKSEDDLVFRQVKAPFSQTGSTVDDSKEILKLSLAEKVTTLSAYTKEGGSVKEGIAKIEGGFEKSGIEFNDLPPFGIGLMNSKVSDCNYRKIIEFKDGKSDSTNSVNVSK